MVAGVGKRFAAFSRGVAVPDSLCFFQQLLCCRSNSKRGVAALGAESRVVVRYDSMSYAWLNTSQIEPYECKKLSRDKVATGDPTKKKLRAAALRFREVIPGVEERCFSFVKGAIVAFEGIATLAHAFAHISQ
jgi:hypothetical protein